MCRTVHKSESWASVQSAARERYYKLQKLEKAAIYFSDGHYTLIRFTTNWGCRLGTVSTPDEVRDLYKGETMEEAIDNCLRAIPAARVIGDMCYWMAKASAKSWAKKDG